MTTIGSPPALNPGGLGLSTNLCLQSFFPRLTDRNPILVPCQVDSAGKSFPLGSRFRWQVVSLASRFAGKSFRWQVDSADKSFRWQVDSADPPVSAKIGDSREIASGHFRENNAAGGQAKGWIPAFRGTHCRANGSRRRYLAFLSGFKNVTEAVDVICDKLSSNDAILQK